MSNSNQSLLLQYYIEQEKENNAFCVSSHDREVLNLLLAEINETTDVDFHYLAELEACSVKGAGEIVKKYIADFDSEYVRSYLLHHLVNDRITDCDKLIYQLYLHFKSSDLYIPSIGQTSNLAIRIRYDNTFRKLKPKRLKTALKSLAFNPRDAFYLPFTMQMLASWRLSDLEQLFISYMDAANITSQSIGLPEHSDDYHPSLSYIRRQLKFTSIYSLKYS
jgi:hypothetical protein